MKNPKKYLETLENQTLSFPTYQSNVTQNLACSNIVPHQQQVQSSAATSRGLGRIFDVFRAKPVIQLKTLNDMETDNVMETEPSEGMEEEKVCIYSIYIYIYIYSIVRIDSIVCIP